MADNVQVTEGSGKSVATDDVGGAQYQRVKIDGGGDGLSVPLIIDATYGVPCDITRRPVIDAATDDITVYAQFDDVATSTPAENALAALRITENRGLHVNLRAQDGSEITTLPVSLASVPSHAVTNAGTFAVQAVCTNAGTFAVQAAATIADGADVTLGSKADAKSTATDTTAVTIMSVLKQISASVQAPPSQAVTNAGTFAVQAVCTNAGTFLVQDQAHTAGGATPYSAISTAAVLTAELKGSAGQIYGIQVFNKIATPIYVRLYNQTGAPASTDGANIVWRGIVPGNTAGAGYTIAFGKGIVCGTGIGIRASGAIADNDTTALGANEQVFNVQYK